MSKKLPKGALDTYLKMVKEISEPMKVVRKISPISSAAEALSETTLSVNQFVNSIEATGSTVNPARFFDSALTIEALANAALSKPSACMHFEENIGNGMANSLL